MAGSILAALFTAGIVERSGAHRGLRLTARFLAHTEGTRGRLHMLGETASTRRSVEAALQTWDNLHVKPPHATELVIELMDVNQSGWIGQPPLDGFQIAA